MLSSFQSGFLCARAGIVGAGTMGAGIALAFASVGIPVTVVDTSRTALDRLQHSLQRRRQSGAVIADVNFSESLNTLAEVDIAIEAVFEDLTLKQGVFKQLGSLCRSDALLATNTSTLDVDAIAAQASYPQRSLGLHFFSPAHVMKLIEIVRGAQTSQQTLAYALTLALGLGKIGVVVGNCDGFVGNRMLYRYRHEAERLLHEGALPQQIDAALTHFGFAMGPFAVSDLAGLDIAYRVKRERAACGIPSLLGQSRIPDLLVEMGRLGQKSGAGYYRYENGERTPHPDPIVEDTIVRERERLGILPRRIEDDEIIKRCLQALAEEGKHILAEGVAQSAADIDTIWVNGYGFPELLGGPMKCAARSFNAR